MRHIVPYGCNALFPFDTSVGGVIEPLLNARFVGIRDRIEQHANEYRNAARNMCLCTIQRTEGVGQVSTEEMETLYTEQMVATTGAARQIYNDIRLLSRRCPFCTHQKTTTLDHYLPKSKFPAFAVDPLNLVPACRDCNTNKGTYSPATRSEQLLHPYFDDFADVRWLYAELVGSNLPKVIFKVIAPPTVSTIEYGRLTKHLERFKLHDLYGDNATSAICDITEILNRQFAAGGVTAVQQYLRGEADTRLAASRNSWQSATYDALANSAQFCNQGWVVH